MKEIDKLRKKIDLIDFKILSLLNKRTEIVKKIGKEKKSINLFRPERQAYILKKLLNKSINNIKPHFILALWRSIFFSQTEMQGGIKLVMLKSMSDNDIKKVYDYFSHDIKAYFFNSFRKAINELKSDKNTFMIMPYPVNTHHKNWWTRKEIKNIYIIAALPFFVQKNKKPSLVVLSKFKPKIDKDSFMLYKSNFLFKEKELYLEAKSSKSYLYRSSSLIKKRNIKLFGVVPKNYEI